MAWPYAQPSWPFRDRKPIPRDPFSINTPPKYVPLADHCNRRSMNFSQWCAHIATCTKPECREILRNHIQTCEAFGVEFHPPRS
jgi:hypothetical protein